MWDALEILFGVFEFVGELSSVDDVKAADDTSPNEAARLTREEEKRVRLLAERPDVAGVPPVSAGRQDRVL